MANPPLLRTQMEFPHHPRAAGGPEGRRDGPHTRGPAPCPPSRPLGRVAVVPLRCFRGAGPTRRRRAACGRERTVGRAEPRGGSGADRHGCRNTRSASSQRTDQVLRPRAWRSSGNPGCGFARAIPGSAASGFGPCAGHPEAMGPFGPGTGRGRAYRGNWPAGRAREFDRMAPGDGRRLRAGCLSTVGLRGWKVCETGRRPPSPDPDNAGEGSPPCRFSSARTVLRRGPPAFAGVNRIPAVRPRASARGHLPWAIPR